VSEKIKRTVFAKKPDENDDMDNNSELSVDPTPSEIEKNVILKCKSEQKILSKESLDYAERIPNQVEKKIIYQITKRFGKH